MDKLTQLKFLMFENEKNNCWLDASVALIAHNKTFKKVVDHSSESQIKNIISNYNEAVSILNDDDNIQIEQRIKKTREMLLEIQTNTLQHLKQFLKFKAGEPDSAFCAVLNLIYHDKSDIKEHLNISWFWKKQCIECGISLKSATFIKPIITLSKVNKFQPECPTSVYLCSCKKEQEMKLIYKELPPCLIFHFEKGAGTGENCPLFFIMNERKYYLTGIIILEKSSDPNLNHFVTWIRHPIDDMWLDCNDLNTNIVSFSAEKPELNLRDVYMYVFEAHDNLGKISNQILVDQEQDIGNLNVEIIDLSDEGENLENGSLANKTSSPKQTLNNKVSSENLQNVSKTDSSKEDLFGNKEKSRISVNFQNSSESDSLKEGLLRNKEEIETTKTVQSLEIPSDEKKFSETESPVINNHKNGSTSKSRFDLLLKNSNDTEHKYEYESQNDEYNKIEKCVTEKGLGTETSHLESEIANALEEDGKGKSSCNRISVSEATIYSKEKNKSKFYSDYKLQEKLKYRKMIHQMVNKTSSQPSFKSDLPNVIKTQETEDCSSSGEKSLIGNLKNSDQKSELDSSTKTLKGHFMENEKINNFGSTENVEKNSLLKDKYFIQPVQKCSSQNTSKIDKKQNISFVCSDPGKIMNQVENEINLTNDSKLHVDKQIFTEEKKQASNKSNTCITRNKITPETCNKESFHEQSADKTVNSNQLSKTFIEDSTVEKEMSELNEYKLKQRGQKVSFKKMDNESSDRMLPQNKKGTTFTSVASKTPIKGSKPLFKSKNLVSQTKEDQACVSSNIKNSKYASTNRNGTEKEDEIPLLTEENLEEYVRNQTISISACFFEQVLLTYKNT